MRWSEFALISPDIWRKQLLDYGTLGPAYKYGGAFTGEELQIIDKKLDRYMARKAERGEMTHLLIDRFRFDSFAPDSDEAGSNLLTRFGHDVYLFFMITPPEALVERAWKRGLELGRYKAVDDTLAHGIDAYAGMPRLIFTWAKRSDKRVQFELLDNSVAAGERPRTVAFGWNRVLNVLDVKCMLDIERFRRVNVDATSPGRRSIADADAPAAGAQRGLPAAMPRAFSRGQFRGSGHGPDLSRVRVGRAGLVRSRRARSGDRQRGDARRPRRRRAFGARPRRCRRRTAPLPRSPAPGDRRWATAGRVGPDRERRARACSGTMSIEHCDWRRHRGAGRRSDGPGSTDRVRGREPAVRAVYDDIRATRKTDYINNFWKVLAHDPAMLARTWAQVKEVMGAGALDPLVKELIYIAVSVTNNCEYCIHSHAAAARSEGNDAADVRRAHCGDGARQCDQSPGERLPDRCRRAVRRRRSRPA